MLSNLINATNKNILLFIVFKSILSPLIMLKSGVFFKKEHEFHGDFGSTEL